MHTSEVLVGMLTAEMSCNTVLGGDGCHATCRFEICVTNRIDTMKCVSVCLHLLPVTGNIQHQSAFEAAAGFFGTAAPIQHSQIPDCVPAVTPKEDGAAAVEHERLLQHADGTQMGQPGYNGLRSGT